ncbi:MAG: phenylalanine--tRNA ligase beta subunit-related protein [Thermoleophilaceae bacterium]
MQDLTPVPSGRGQRRKARTVAAILDAAERRLGDEELRVDEIAADADVAVGSIYNHFGSKEGLEQALTDRALELHALYMDEGRDTDLPALEQLLDTAGRLARFGREQPGQLRLLVRARESERVAAHLADQERRTAALVEAAVRKGEVRPLNARHAAGFLWSAWLGMLALGGRADESRLRGVIEAGLRIVLGGLATESARDSSDVVRAILETSPARPAPAPARGRGLALRREPVAHDLRAEFPELALWTATVDASPGRTPAAVARRLRAMRERLTGARATGARDESTPWAYRVFVRRLGIDPATAHDPVEEAALQRLAADGLESRALPADALLVAALETGVPVLAFDADALEGTLSLRHAAAGDRLGGDGRELAPGEAVIADRLRPVAVLFGDRATDCEPGHGTERIALAALQVKGLGDVSVQEALWTAVDILETAR